MNIPAYNHYLPTDNKNINILSESNDELFDIDWVKRGAVSSVKNQMNCGGCWSFSAAEAIEGEYYIKHKNLYNLSEQELIDCSGYLGNNGCDGGSMVSAFKYVISNGLCLDNNYSYTIKQGMCQNTTCGRKSILTLTISSIRRSTQKALMRQPMSVAIQGNKDHFNYINLVYMMILIVATN